MNRKNLVVLAVLLGFSLSYAFGQGSAAESDLFLKSLQPQGAVSDWAGVFTPEQKAALDSRIAALRQANGAQLAVVALKSLKGGEIDDFAVKLFAQWGIGEKGKDNGVLLLAAIEDRKMRIEVGYGFEGDLTDAGTGRIQDEYILPRFKEGNFAQGLSDGADALLKVMGGEKLPEPVQSTTEGSPLVGLVVLVFFVAIFVLIVRAAIRGNKGGGSGGSLSSGWKSGGSSGGGGSGGFGGGSSGGGGSSRSW